MQKIQIMKAIAERKKASNLPEYIIYMYQMEDLIRAYGFSMEEIRQYVIVHYPISEDAKAETLTWFGELAEQMKLEGIEKTGRLKSTQNKVDKLAKLHWELLKTDKDYYAIYQKAKPHVIKLVMEAGDNPPSHEIQVCINAIYGLLLAKLHGREIPEGLTEATESFGDVLSYLNYVLINDVESNINKTD